MSVVEILERAARRLDVNLDHSTAKQVRGIKGEVERLLSPQASETNEKEEQTWLGS